MSCVGLFGLCIFRGGGLDEEGERDLLGGLGSSRKHRDDAYRYRLRR